MGAISLHLLKQRDLKQTGRQQTTVILPGKMSWGSAYYSLNSCQVTVDRLRLFVFIEEAEDR